MATDQDLTVLLRDVTEVLQPFCHGTLLFDRYASDCLDAANIALHSIGENESADGRRLHELRNKLSVAEAYCRGEDLDTVTAHHLSPLISAASEASFRLADVKSRPKGALEAIVKGGTRISTYPYFEILLCKFLTDRVREYLNSPHSLAKHW